ncbi:MAG TPA: HAMP domain-containing protein, partial [Candidatus Solibacter sp.]|nr:HAMP domain-containing protein [Candidatus Solibacter sp.]
MAFFVLLALDLALAYLAPGAGFRLLVAIALYVTGLLFALQLIRRNMRRLIWRLRNRLIVAYLFIAFVPIVLIAILVGIGGRILTGQTAVYLVSSELDRRTAALHGVAQMLADTPAAKRQNTIREVAPYIRNRFPTAEVLIRGEEVYRYPQNSTLEPPPAAWKDASGLITKDSRLCSWAHVTAGDTDVTLLAPLNSRLLADLVPGIGEVFFGSLNARSRNTNDPNVPRNQRGGRLPPASNNFDVDVPWIIPVALQYWETPGRQGEVDLIVHTRPSVVLGTVFGQMNYAQGVLAAFLVVAAILLLVELVSLIIGVSMTRTITGAVHNLYEGTQRVKEGDFSHRIAVEGNDQLAELGRSFNGMTENLERLIVIEKEQERL